jgi:hypothetical protein
VNAKIPPTIEQVLTSASPAFNPRAPTSDGVADLYEEVQR